jgi:hypothetical protein
MTATAFSHTRRAWARLVYNLRSGLSFWLLSLAMTVATERERFALAMAARDHAYRTMGMDVK